MYEFLRRRRGTIAHYTGHRILKNAKRSRFPAPREREVSKVLDRVLKRERVKAGYGALASGSDILFAEALLRRGSALHVVLAVTPERFAEASVAEAGRDWIDRFNRALERASSITLCDQSEGGEIDFGSASDMALDAVATALEIQKARPLQIAIYDGEADESSDAGTGADIGRGAARGWRQIIITLPKRGKIRVSG